LPPLFPPPEAINTFFSILNFKKISDKYNYRSIIDCQKYIPELYSNKEYSTLKYSYNKESLKEPYYCFYFWAHLNNFKFLYLDTVNPVGDDMVGNIVLFPTGEKMALHSWYARAYEVHNDQTIRLNSFLKDYNIEDASVDWKEIQVFKNIFFNWKKRAKVFAVKLFKNK
ncbi:hypothetical protein B0E44_18555, partial [Flavobacterium sp. A45]